MVYRRGPRSSFIASLASASPRVGSFSIHCTIQSPTRSCLGPRARPFQPQTRAAVLSHILRSYSGHAKQSSASLHLHKSQKSKEARQGCFLLILAYPYVVDAASEWHLAIVALKLHATQDHRGPCRHDEHGRVWVPPGQRTQESVMNNLHSPLQIVWSGVSMLSVRAKRTDITRRVMHQAMPYHLVLTFESFSTLAARALWYWAVVRSVLTVHIPMRTSFMSALLQESEDRPDVPKQVLSLKRYRSTARIFTFECSWNHRHSWWRW